MDSEQALALRIAEHLAVQYADRYRHGHELDEVRLEGDWSSAVDGAVALKWFWLTRKAGQAERGAPLSAALRRAVQDIREIGVAHHRVRGKRARLTTSAHDRMFKPTCWFRMVLGTMNCETLNYLLFQRLRLVGVDAYLYEVAADDEGGTHTCVLAMRGGEWAFADAWTDQGLVVLEQAEMAETFRNDHQLGHLDLSRPAAGVASYDRLLADGTTVSPTNLIERERLIRGRSFPMGALFRYDGSLGLDGDAVGVLTAQEESDVPLDPEVLEHRRPDPPPASAWTRFVSMRSAILLDPAADPGSMYRSFVERERIDDSTRALVEALIRATEANP